MFGFEKLEVWKKSIEYADAIYKVTRNFPDYERFGLRVQLQRAAVSISSNVSEGSGRTSKKDFARFVELSYGSLMETVSQLCIAQNQKFVSTDDVSDLRARAEELARMLSGLKGTLIRKNQYAVKVGDLQWVRIPPGQSVARPEATRAAQEVTNVLKYSGVTGRFR